MKKVVYTAIFGKYDLNEPLVANYDWEFLCFTDKDIKSKRWKVIKIENDSNKRKKSREVKITNHRFFEYDLCLYLDSRFTVKQDLNLFVKSNLKTDIAVMKKKKRSHVYDEANFCIEIGKDSKEVITEQINRYKNENFPDSFGLFSPGIMIKRNTPHIRTFMDMWYSEVERHSYRDILSFPYVLWKHPTEISLMPFVSTYSSFMKREEK